MVKAQEGKSIVFAVLEFAKAFQPLRCERETTPYQKSRRHV